MKHNRPNILFINSDQHRFDCVGVNGNSYVKTPNLDRLATKGMNFRNAFTPIPLCCPARQTLLCGVRPEIHGGLWNYNGGGHKIGGLAPDNTQWPSILKKHGYQTAYLGKWHVHPEFDPTAFGYDYYLPYALSRRPANWDWSQMKSIRGLDMIDEGPLETAGTHRLVQACIEKIREFERKDMPWHIRLDHDEPHLPNFPVKMFHDMYPSETVPKWPAFDDKFTDKPYIQRQQAHSWDIQDWTWLEFSRFAADYYAIISQLDDALGRVFDYLEESGAINNTIVIYTTDHGDMTGNHRMLDKHYNMYDDIVHVPMIIRWDGVIAPGATCDDLLCHYLDLAPTMLDIINADIPDTYQGESLLPLLKGGSRQPRRDYVLSSYNGQQFGLYTQRMIRTPDLKLVWNLTDIDELYDMKNDPAELVNQVHNPEYAERLRALRLKLYDALKEACDPLVDTVWMREQLLYNRKIAFHP
jgi:arylsulfatase A-like enzyme